MPAPAALGLDLAVTGVTAVLLDAGGAVLATQAAPLATRTAQGPAGPAEVLGLDAVWRAVDEAGRAVLAGRTAASPLPTGVAVAAEVWCCWDAETLGSPLPALTGGVGPAWWAADAPRTWEEVAAERYVLGDLGSWLLARATRGVEHLTTTALARRPADVPVEALPEEAPAVTVLTDAPALLGTALRVGVLLDRSALDGGAGEEPAVAAARVVLPGPRG
ncbi:hypothetical protein [Nocardioides bruguierae]|uniref:hypothetical protein n=1 Tax=Nocardioides bruguierae TaxID=2945102 RepID=UPI00201FF6E9|nr:hypothetical protein [Nocardioides bruguierae]MCL8027024.1 hypothetical protein [Nocardioides bruguierae]